MIDPDIDAYGTYARGSALADYLEALALVRKRCTRAQLEDAVKDRQWTRKKSSLVIPGGIASAFDDSDSDDQFAEDVESHVAEAFTCLGQRADILGDRYPFELDSYGVTLRTGTLLNEDAYVALLCLTLAHAYKIAVPVDVTQLFETVVADVLESRQLLTARVGAIYRSNDEGAGQTFPRTLEGVGSALGIPTLLDAAPRQRFANDMGADVITHLSWRDERPGRILQIWQVTCGSSDSWKRKLGEASPGLWKDWFQEHVLPSCGLAVPHHVPAPLLHLLVQEQSKIVVDRLRLVMARGEIAAAEAHVVAAVIEAGVNNVAAA